MKRLTQKQAEKCARACEYVYSDGVIPGVGKGCPAWVSGKGKRVMRPDLLDPYFWFPRLTVRRHDLLGSKIDMAECLNRLCESIEALENK